MSSLVEELQRDALDHRVRVSDILRKAKAIAVKLDLQELEKWVESELNGYQSNEVPNYRIAIGQVKGLNPFRGGWQPVVFPNTEMEQAFSNRPIIQRIAELESLVADAANVDALQILFPSEGIRLLTKLTGINTEFSIHVPKSRVIGILDAVRSALLDWSLKLEKSGVKGEGMSFSSDERKKAHETQAVFHIGRIGTFTGTMGSGSGDFTVQGDVINADSKAAILDLVGKIRSNEAQLGLEPASAQSLSQTLNSLEREVKSRKPVPARVREFLASIRNIAEGAAGSLIAQGILYELSKLMS